MPLFSLFRSIFYVNTTVFRNFSSVTKPPVTPESLLSYSDSVLVLSLVLPSRQETCRFHLNLQLANVGQLIEEIKGEDPGIEHVHIFDGTNQLLARSYSIQSLITSPFTIQLNRQRTFVFDPINKLQIKEKVVRENLTDGLVVDDTVAALHRALNVMRNYHTKHLELKKEANDLTAQLESLEKVKSDVAKVSQRYTLRWIWCGLAAMSFQVGFLAELTWKSYSWDIAEPISYFMAFSTAMFVYAFHLMTRSDFEYLTMSDRFFLRKFHREARRQSFDLSLYNRLKNRLFLVHTDLARLRAPLSLSLPVPPNAMKCKISGDEISPLNMYRESRRIDM